MAYAAPTAIFVAVLFVIPIIVVFRMSASQWPLLSGDHGINVPDNFQSVLTSSLLGPAIVFTIEYTLIVTLLLIGIGLGLALIVQTGGRWVGFLRTTFMLPVAVGLASASLLFLGLYSAEIGPFTGLFQALGISPLLTPLSALISTVLLVVWKFAGFYMLILLVGVQSIPSEVYEAAAIDGAGRWQTFRRITLPLLRPSLALSLILCITGSLLAFDQFYILTKGGPDNSTVTVVQLIYREAFQRTNLGTAAALSVIVLAVLVVLNVAQFRGLRASEPG